MSTQVAEKELLRMLRAQRRVKQKAPKVETPKTVYSRKAKHKRRYSDDASSFFVMTVHPVLRTVSVFCQSSLYRTVCRSRILPEGIFNSVVIVVDIT